jgi:thiamine-monophosphate kinase
MAGMLLSDLGERRLLREVIPKFAVGTGDDCATLTVGSGYTVATTDPVPKPAASVIAGDDDPYWMGWLLVTINASDIAASGAEPMIFLAAFDLPRDWPVSSLERLMAGIKDSCLVNGLRYSGGNLREAEKLSAVGSAIGYSESRPLTRTGARVGSRVVVFGNSGRFWSDAFRHRAGQAIDKNVSPIFSPISQSRVIYDLHRCGFLACAMDTSDGLAPSLEELSAKNGLGIVVDLERVRANSEGLFGGVGSERFWFGWGDWTVVAAVHEETMKDLLAYIGQKGYVAHDIGHFSDVSDGVTLVDGLRRARMGRLESERFAKDSWFHLGVEAYERLLVDFPLP